MTVSLSVSTNHMSLPMAWRLYLPESWASDRQRRKATGVPKEIGFQTKPAIALAQIGQAVEQGVPRAPVLADSAYSNETRFREGITELDLQYAVGAHENLTVWPPGEVPPPKKRRKSPGASAHTVAPGCAASAGGRERAGPFPVGTSVEYHYLA